MLWLFMSIDLSAVLQKCTRRSVSADPFELALLTIFMISFGSVEKSMRESEGVVVLGQSNAML